MYKKLETALAEKGWWKVKAAKKVASFSEKFLRKNIRRRLFSPVQERFGGCLRTMITGGAAIDPAVARGFRELGFTFLQGYGLTESSPIIAVNRDAAFKDDAAGLPLPSMEVKIAGDGEILAAGPNIMQGYYQNPEGTREILKDGWLHTGDLGYLDKDGFLHIQGRKKSLIVTPGGKKIHPEEIEEEILKSPWVAECLVWGGTADNPGDNEEIEAVVVPDAEYLAGQGLVKSGDDGGAMEERLVREVKQRCRNLAPYKRVARITVRDHEFEKTTTKKIKRFLYVNNPAGSGGPQL
jgi:long-chain acyl-CoA synthetase